MPDTPKSESQQESTPKGHAHPDPAIATESDYSPPRGNPFPIVGIGASAGGLEAVAQLLESIPPETGLSFVLVQHLDPEHESMLSQILKQMTPLPVTTVQDHTKVEPDHIYVIPPNASMELEDGHLRIIKREPGLHLPIDIFLRSLATVQGSRAIGVILSGNASDGSLGVRAIKAECGITFAQDQASARFGGMPRSAIATGAIDYVLPPDEIGKELVRLGLHRFMITPRAGIAEAETLPEGDGDLKKVLAILQVATKVDFSQYKLTTIQRRISRRLMILRMDSLSDYAQHLRNRPGEIGELYKDLLISVTSFFRDPDAFEALITHLKASIVQDPQRQDALRLWIPGCATGEEVYSLAIRLHEFLVDAHPTLNLQLFGTDISEPALERARQGIYGPLIAENVSEQRLRRFFTKMDGGFQIRKAIRECCVFARHDLTRDAPFSRIDVVSCRSVLIYLDNKAQRKVLPTFHYALNPNGLLLLGSAETTGAAADLFTPFDKTHHLYGRKAVPTRMTIDFTSGGIVKDSRGSVPGKRHGSLNGELDFQQRLERMISARYSPDGVVVNSDLQILQFKGHTAPFLDPSPGEASFNLLRMLREGLVVPLRRAVQKAVETDALVRGEEATLEIEGRQEHVTLEVAPVPVGDGPERCFLIVFIRNGRTNPRLAEMAASSPDGSEEALLVKRELAETREYLRHVREEYEANVEELRAANEEARSANEELQSTNEELGTTKEELQSANEELTTVNEELQNRNRELAGTNSDLRNVLSAVAVAVVMVDPDYRVRRFNTAAEKLLELSSLDIGRPIAHLRGRIETPRLEEHIRRVLESLNAITEEVQDSAGVWFSICVRPYRTLDERIAGAVITFQDIDPLKRGLEVSEEAREYAESLIETVREPLVVLDGDLRVQRATEAFYSSFLLSREETEGRFIYDLGSGQWNRPRLRELLGAALFRSEPFHDYELEHDFPHIGHRTLRLNARQIPRRDPKQRTVLLAMEDVTDRREIAEIRFQRLFETAKDGIIVIDIERETVQDVNPYFLQLSCYALEELAGKRFSDLASLLGIDKISQIFQDSRDSEVVRYEGLVLVSKDGKQTSVEAVGNRYKVGGQRVIQLNIRDVSARKESERALKESEEHFRVVVESIHDYAIFPMDDEGRITSWNLGAERLLGWSEGEIFGQSSSVMFTSEDVESGEYQRELETARTQGHSKDERWHVRKDGSRFFASGVLTRARNSAVKDGLGYIKVMQDVTVRKAQDDQLRRSLEEKSLLVREIHHRVKNNLQMVISLLSLQSMHTADPQVIAAFDETESRVRAIAQIHEVLYGSEDLTTVEIGAYLSSLARSLVDLHARSGQSVRLVLRTQQIYTHLEKAVPLGLIANELILNSLKHALKSSAGDLEIVLETYNKEDEKEQWVQLSVRDSGPGFPREFEIKKSKSMGLQLVTLLARQLRAQVTISKGPEAQVQVQFPLPHKQV